MLMITFLIACANVGQDTADTADTGPDAQMCCVVRCTYGIVALVQDEDECIGIADANCAASGDETRYVYEEC